MMDHLTRAAEDANSEWLRQMRERHGPKQPTPGAIHLSVVADLTVCEDGKAPGGITRDESQVNCETCLSEALEEYRKRVERLERRKEALR